MPRKATTCLTKQAYPPFSRRQWYTLRMDRVNRSRKGDIVFDLSVVGGVKQVGRTLTHKLPVVLAPGSPLDRFLTVVLGAELEENQSVDLATLMGREFEARFTAAGADGHQMIAEIRPADRPQGCPAGHDKTAGAEGLS